MKRREFIKILEVGGLGILTGVHSPLTVVRSILQQTPRGEQRSFFDGVERAIASSQVITSQESPDLVMAKGKDSEKITRTAIEILGGMNRFISRGDVVVVKPNMAWDRTPEQAANTNPQVVKAIVEMAFEAGAKKVKIFDRPVNDERRVHVTCGIPEVCRKVGAQVSFIDNRKFKQYKIGGESLKKWPIYIEILEADKVINVPIAKVHSSTTLTMAMKNWFGALGGWRARLHFRLHQKIADLQLVFKPALTVLDSVRILVDNGPSGGNLEDVRGMNLVIAGIDQVAVDSLGATLFGMKGEDIDYIKIASSMGLGRIDLENLRIRKLEVT